MVQKSEIQIFLAHAHEDKEVVFELYDRLKKAGYKPWMDKKDLIPGQNWRSVIPRVIKDSQLFIACFSESLIAKPGFVQNEFKIALNQLASLPPNSIYFIPLRFDECEIPDLRQEEYGLNLRDIHWLDYWEADGFDELEKAIAHQYGEQFINENTKPVERVELKTSQFQSFTEDLGNDVKLEMVAIDGGKFLMGTEDEEIERLIREYDDERFRAEKPQHEVTVQSFFMGKYSITQAQYQEVMGKNPSRFKGDDHPVEQVSWFDAEEFCQKLSEKTGKEYRLPSEAEWEYACRAGTMTQFHFGETITSNLANYRDSSTYIPNEPRGRYRTITVPVGSFQPNAFGLYDMHGNIWEWCQDNSHENYEGALEDGNAWLSGDSSRKVIRGGSCFSYPWFCRSANRFFKLRPSRLNYIGFRVVCIAPRT